MTRVTDIQRQPADPASLTPDPQAALWELPGGGVVEGALAGADKVIE